MKGVTRRNAIKVLCNKCNTELDGALERQVLLDDDGNQIQRVWIPSHESIIISKAGARFAVTCKGHTIAIPVNESFKKKHVVTRVLWNAAKPSLKVAWAVHAGIVGKNNVERQLDIGSKFWVELTERQQELLFAAHDEGLAIETD